MYILKIIEEQCNEDDNLKSSFVICLSQDKEKLENLISIIIEEIENFFSNMKLLYRELDRKYHPKSYNIDGAEELNVRTVEIQSEFKNLIKYNIFDFIDMFCINREFVIEEKIEI